MKFSTICTTLASSLALVSAAQPKHKRSVKSAGVAIPDQVSVYKCSDAISPKVVIISLFEPEMAVWHEHIEFTHNITIPGLSPLFPHVFCTENYDLCQIVTGESEINAASTTSALLLSPIFDVSKTYFLIAGIAGINPYEGTTGSAAFSRFAVSVALQYEVDAREIPANWTSGYYAFGSTAPGEYPGNWYGTEVFELNANLRDRAVELAKTANLTDGATAEKFRALYDYAPANQPPSVLSCDAATSDVYYTGPLLGESFGNFTKLLTNGTGTYCTTAQEDTAILEAMVRNGRFGLVDYSRIVLMRTASDFDRAPPGEDAVDFFNNAEQGGFGLAIDNIYNAGNPFVQDVLSNWDSVYADGKTYAPSNYIGDVFGYLGGSPDFGPGSYMDYDYL